MKRSYSLPLLFTMILALLTVLLPAQQAMGITAILTPIIHPLPNIFAPTVTGISPNSGFTAGGTAVTITGTNLTGATSVKFGSSAVTGVTVNSSTSITATSPAGSAGVVDVTVTTPEGTSATSSADQFTYMAPLPIVNPTITAPGLVPVEPNSPSNGSTAQTVLHFHIGSTDSDINGQAQPIDTPPVISNGRTLLPIKFVATPLGATVSWDAAQQMVTVTLGSTTIKLWIGKGTAMVNGVATPIDPGNPGVTPMIVNGRTMLPLAFIAKNLGCQVGWNAITHEVTVTWLGAETAQNSILKSAGTVALNTLSPGNTVTFAGYTWIVLDPSTGYLLMQNYYKGSTTNATGFFDVKGGNSFDPTSSSNIAYFLNNISVSGGFYCSLPATDQALIQSHSWTTGDEKHDTNSSPAVTCKVGLISYSEYNEYTSNGTDFSIISKLSDDWWTRTPVFDTPGAVKCVASGGFVYNASASDNLDVRPALYINPDILVYGGNTGTIEP